MNMLAGAGSASPGWSFLLLTVAFTVKHYLADFVLQTNWIAHGKDRPNRWLAPLLAHGGFHAGLTLLIVLAVAPALWWLAAADLAIHLAVDRGKTLVGRWGGWDIRNPRFWWLFGFDQLLHQITNVGLAAILAAARQGA